jgi:hypothetical protein
MVTVTKTISTSARDCILSTGFMESEMKYIYICIVIDLSYIMYNDPWRRNKSKSKYIYIYIKAALSLSLSLGRQRTILQKLIHKLKAKN